MVYHDDNGKVFTMRNGERYYPKTNHSLEEEYSNCLETLEDRKRVFETLKKNGSVDRAMSDMKKWRDDKMSESFEIPGLSKEQEVVQNESGAKQSKSYYRMDLIPMPVISCISEFYSKWSDFAGKYVDIVIQRIYEYLETKSVQCLKDALVVICKELEDSKYNIEISEVSKLGYDPATQNPDKSWKTDVKTVEKSNSKSLANCFKEVRGKTFYEADVYPYHINKKFIKQLFILSETLRHGEIKYSAWNWLDIPVDDNLNHALVHLFAHIAGNNEDQHIAHAFCRIAFAFTKAYYEGSDYFKQLSK